MAFEGIVSAGAAKLYESLLMGVHVTVDEDAHNPEVKGSPAEELVRCGLASVSDRGDSRLFPAEPSAAQATLIRNIAASISTEHKRLVAAIEGFSHLSVPIRPSLFSDTEILTDPNKISHLSFEILHLAREDLSSFVTEHMERPQNQRSAMPKPTLIEAPMVRTIYTASAVGALRDAIDTSIGEGEQARIVDTLPYKMIIVDNVKALVAIDKTGLHAALFTSSSQLIHGFRMLFESAWQRAATYPAGHPEEVLTPQERRVMSLLATGAKDEAIARQLDVTVRTVRRHITTAMTKLGADNRFAAGVQATKRGWI